MNVEEAKRLKAGDTVYHVSKKNADGSPMNAKVTSVKTWKTMPGRVVVSVKRGLYEYAKFNENDIYQLTY
jgi:hypothetical protein